MVSAIIRTLKLVWQTGKDDMLESVSCLWFGICIAEFNPIHVRRSPVNFPGKPCFTRQPPIHNQWMKYEAVNDDMLVIVSYLPYSRYPGRVEGLMGRYVGTFSIETARSDN